MPLVLYLLLIAILMGIGLRALAGHGFALTLYRSFHGPSARPLGALFLAAGLALAAWLALNPDIVALLWRRGRP